MKLLMVGGFLGAGKTTYIKKIIPKLQKQGKKIAVIENEFGTENIDGAVLGESNLEIREISGGCVCCQIAGSLIGAMAEIEEEINPDWLIVELSGMAVTKNAVDTVKQFYRPDLEILTIVVVDASRYDVLMKVAGPRINSQLEGADSVYLNRTDGKTFNPDKTTSMLKSEDEPGKIIVETESHDGNLVISDIKGYVKGRLNDIGKNYAIDDIIPGHIKAIAKFDGGFVAASMTRLDEVNFNVEQKNSEPITHYDLTINILLAN